MQALKDLDPDTDTDPDTDDSFVNGLLSVPYAMQSGFFGNLGIGTIGIEKIGI